MKRFCKKGIAGMAAISMVASYMPIMASASEVQESSQKFVFTESGISAEADGSGCQVEGTTLTIEKGGVYQLSGNCSNGNVVIKKDTTGVTLVLDNLSLTAETTAAICANKSSEVEIQVKEGTENTLSDTTQENEEKAVVKAKSGASLTITGGGILNVSGNYQNGINGAEDTTVTIEETQLNVNAVKNGVASDDVVIVKSGEISITAGNDGIHADNVLTLGVQNADDADLDINVNESEEGIEAAAINIYSGNIDLTSNDDGINASSDTTTDISLSIYGGNIFVNAEGDGLDSNGNINMYGGVLNVYGAASDGTASDNSPIDYDGIFTLTGGTVFGAGSSAMAQTPTDSASTQDYVTFFGNASKGEKVAVMTSEGTELYSTTLAKNVNYVIYSSADISDNESYVLQVGEGDSAQTIESGSNQNQNPWGGGQMPGGGPGSGQQPPSGMPQITGGAMPSGMPQITGGAMPSGMPQITGGAMPSGMPQITGGAMPSGMPGEPGQNPGMGGSTGVDSYNAVNNYTSDTTVENETLDSTGTDENAVLVSENANVSLKNVEVTRESSDSTGGDQASFYGVGAAVLATSGTAYVNKSTIETDAAGGAGLFAYDKGTIYAADTKIKTEQDTSGGIHAAGGGTLYAWDLDVETDGNSSAAIRSDRGGGTMIVDGGTYTSNGTGSPAVYCTADIAVNDSELTANGSEAVCIEGLNSLRLYDCDITGNMSDDSQNDCTWNVIVYQSMSGDSQIGNSTLQVEGGSITCKNGGVFYTTNTECTITLKDVEIIPCSDSEFFLRCTGNNNQRGWGQTGNNGSDCLFTAISQEMEGDVIWDSISNLDFYMTEGSSLEGAFLNDETYAGNGGNGYCNVYISSDSALVVTKDSKISKLYSQGTIVDEDGNQVSVVGTDGTVYVEGNSQLTITVDSYSDTVDLSGIVAVDSWENYEVEMPENLKSDGEVTTTPEATVTATPEVTTTPKPTVTTVPKATTVPNVTVTKIPEEDGNEDAQKEIEEMDLDVNVKASKSLTLKWEKISGADGYEIYRSTSKNGKYKKIKTLKNQSVTTYKDTSVKYGTTYYYQVKAYETEDGELTYIGVSDVVKATSKPTAATIKSIVGKKGKVVLKWKKDSSVSGYTIYRSTTKNGKYTKVTTVKSASKTTYTDTKVKSGKKYYYKICSYKKVNGKNVYGSYSAVKAVKTK